MDKSIHYMGAIKVGHCLFVVNRVSREQSGDQKAVMTLYCWNRQACSITVLPQSWYDWTRGTKGLVGRCWSSSQPGPIITQLTNSPGLCPCPACVVAAPAGRRAWLGSSCHCRDACSQPWPGECSSAQPLRASFSPCSTASLGDRGRETHNNMVVCSTHLGVCNVWISSAFCQLFLVFIESEMCTHVVHLSLFP